MAVSRALRFQVLRRDGYRCHYCGATAAQAKLTVDHVTATALGGTDTADNLVTACEPCNSGKSATPADAALVAGVQERDRQFQTAVAAVSQDDRERRWFADAFLEAWDLGELPPGWRKTIDSYRQQGLTSDAWDEIVGIARDKANLDDPFRYCCGIARNQIKKIQQQAAEQLASAAESADAGDPAEAIVLEAAFQVWLAGMSDSDEPVPAEQIEQFRRSLEEVSHWDKCEPGRIVAAAQHATYFGFATIGEALRDLDRDKIWRAWITAWPTTYVPGDPEQPFSGTWIGGPSDTVRELVRDQIEKFLDTDMPPVFRLAQAATHAGFHKSARLYKGLTDQELRVTGQTNELGRAKELWRTAFTASEGREPNQEEANGLHDSIRAIVMRPDGTVNDGTPADLFEAALWAGSYQDPQLSTCVPMYGSVFEAAAAIPPLPE